MADKRTAQTAALKEKMIKSYGHKSATTGFDDDTFLIENNVVSTGSLVWDYMLGTGGWPYGASVEVFGPESIGKSTSAGYSVLRNVQAQGGVTATIACEPDYDENWAIRNGVDPEYNVTLYPDNGEEAFDMLRDIVFGDEVNYVLFDSLGGLSSEKEIKSDVPQAYGNSALITWGVKRVAMRAKKNNIGIMYINQARDDTNARFAGSITSPGGRALKHMMRIRAQMKPGKDRYIVKEPGVGDSGTSKAQEVVVGRQLVAVMKKNKAAEGLGKTAKFDYFHIETDEYPFGFDVAKDVIAAGKLAGVITGAGWLNHNVFPKGKINGAAAAGEFLLENPEAIAEIRNDVLKVMTEKEQALAAKARAKRKATRTGTTTTRKRNLKAVSNDG